MFVSERQEQLRAATIGFFYRYLRSRADLLRETGETGNSDGMSEDDLALLRKHVARLEAGAYLLTVVGESKAGKSTFINALLRRQLLPTDALQCTSGIIEILDTANPRDASKVFLAIRYGDDPDRLEYHSTSSADTQPIHDRLGEVAAIRPEYRPLPLFQLNTQLLKDRPEAITDEYVDALLAEKDEAGKAVFDNPHRLPPQDFKKRVSAYLDEYRNLSRIPTSIKVGFPLALGFSDLRIVDTPGVNARGGLEEVTLKYMLEANAILFIHPLGNVASASLERFFDRSIPQQAKRNIFLFLTYRANYRAKDVAAMVEEAQRLFPQPDIRRGRIVAVDSLLKQIANLLDAGVPLPTIKEDEQLWRLLAPYLVGADEDRGRLRRVIGEESGFDAAENLIREFAGRAFSDEVTSICDRIVGGYRQQQGIYAERIRLLNSKMTRSPADFAAEIETLKKMLDEYQSVLGSFSRELRKEYAGTRSAVSVDFDDMAARFKKGISGAESIAEIRTEVLDFNKECGDRLNERIGKLRQAFEAKMAEVGESFKDAYNISPPAVALDDISKHAEERAYDFVTFPGDRNRRAAFGGVLGAILGGVVGFVFLGGPVGAIIGATAGGAMKGADEYLDGTPARTERIRSESKHFQEFKAQAEGAVSSVSTDMKKAVSSVFDGYSTDFAEKLQAVITSRQEAYDALKVQKRSAEALQEDIERLQTYEAAADSETAVIRDIRQAV